jgi:hypothetical protein
MGKKPNPVWYVPAGDIHLRFSFKYLDVYHLRFSVSKCGESFLVELATRLKEYSTWTVEQFRDANNTVEHRHPIYFPDTSEPQGFTGIDPEEFADGENWQFSVSLSPGCMGRVHGVLLGDTFFVVWLDKCHRLYPKQWSC